MTNPFDDFPSYTTWFLGEKALQWRKDHEAEILEAIEAQDKLDALKKRYVENRGCPGDCENCDTDDWCLFTLLSKPELKTS